MTISPALNRVQEAEVPTNAAQQEPDRMAWKLITCSASGMTAEAIAAECGDSPTQGAWRCRSKKIAPVRCTVFSTSERTSITACLPVSDDRARKADNPAYRCTLTYHTSYALEVITPTPKSDEAPTLKAGIETRRGYDGISGDGKPRTGCANRLE